MFDEAITNKISSKFFENILQNLRDDFSITYNVTLSIGIGVTAEVLELLYSSYKEAKRSCESEAINQSRNSSSKILVLKNISAISGDSGNIADINSANHILSGKIINEDLNNCISMLLKSFINYISSYKKSKNIDVVEKVKNYIENNYM